ncbi:head-tail adaptor protein [Paracoccus sp. 1_MG-2023]|uniref:head-tail adaptor protein n=1 Tax=unclassified Paracoccus (in: a-proteobacteria) TaxID=2688777 RepID=UPI001C09473E|nr:MULTISPECIES: head-tail adaptor protein [unclassified Paracoccus (in: a-proteobacteria)]MBU2958631.1 head-tail adaptor protein [Paracoccus sp. C2R09]MDO6667624.1 head-tail adaptor protein [Paracoccus sp. 1_MG-2023]
MSTPELNVALDLEAPDRVADGMGGWTTGWRRLGRLWCAMDARSGREKTTRLGMVSVVQWRITTHAAPAGDPRRPEPGQRLRNGTRVFVIEAVAEAGGRHLDCFAREEDQA